MDSNLDKAMLHDLIDPQTTDSPEDLRQRYESELADILKTYDTEVENDVLEIAPSTLETIRQGNAASVPIADVARVIALQSDSPDPDEILSELRNHLLLQMSTAILNIDLLAQELDLDLDPNELQGKIEGRLPMTLTEFVTIHYYLTNNQTS